MKLLLDMYKGVSKDQRDKVQLMATEKKLRSEIEDFRNQLKKMQVSCQQQLIIAFNFITINHVICLIGEQKRRTKEISGRRCVT